jgi:hypothetical protein
MKFLDCLGTPFTHVWRLVARLTVYAHATYRSGWFLMVEDYFYKRTNYRSSPTNTVERGHRAHRDTETLECAACGPGCAKILTISKICVQYRQHGRSKHRGFRNGRWSSWTLLLLEPPPHMFEGWSRLPVRTHTTVHIITHNVRAADFVSVGMGHPAID